jgi:hypothetical protein
MPFTLSHAVAVLPLTRSRRLVPAALVIGSWVPDLPYFVPLLGGSGRTHAASGPVTVDLLLGLMTLVLWQLVLRRPLVDLAPTGLRERVPPPRRLDARYAFEAALSVVLGAATHVLWDTFTHPDRWGTSHLTLLTEALGPLPIYKWLQFGSGVLGLLGLLLWVALWLRRTPPRPTSSQVSPKTRRAVGVGISAVAVLVGGLIAVTELNQGTSLEAAAFAAVTRSMGAAAAAIVLVGLVWLVFDRFEGRATPMRGSR